MAFTFGFYNALNHDRRYNAIQVSSIFDGIIKDGIFMSIGGHMNVKATGNGFNIVVESGRAWFNHTWSLLDADYPMVVSPSDVLEDRIDAVVLEVNENVDVRQNFIKIISGTPAEKPTKPALTNNLDIHQYALAYITVPANSVTLTQSNVENAIGLGSTPFVTGILETINIDDLVAQWKSQWNDWTEEVDLNWNNWFDTVDNAWTTWFTQQQSNWEDILVDRTEEWEEIKDTVDSEWAAQQGSINSDYTNWKQTALAAYNQWLDQIKGTLDDDAATQLAKEVVELKNRDDVISTYQHVKSGTEHMFIGSGSNGKVKMTADIASGDKVVISSAPKEKITVEGDTSQPGSGDPSPDNIRMISGVGAYDRCVVFDGSNDEHYWFVSDDSTRPYYAVDLPASYPTADWRTTHPLSNWAKYYGSGTPYDVMQNFSFQPNTPGIGSRRIFIKMSAKYSTISELRTYLAENPLILWYQSVNYAKSTGPFYYVHEVSDGTESPYKAIGIELNAPLFDGDSLEIGGLSGFDKMLVLDGKEEKWRLSSGDGAPGRTYVVLDLDVDGSVTSGMSVSTNASWSRNVSADWASLTSPDGKTYFVRNDGNKTTFCTRYDSGKRALQSYLSSHPLIVFYKSVNYTPEADIAVALESHARGYAVFDGDSDYTYRWDTEGAVGRGSANSLMSRGATWTPFPISSHFIGAAVQNSNSVEGIGLHNDYAFFRDPSEFSDLTTFKQFLSAQYSAGTPVQVVYELASAVTYAHPIQAELLPAYYGTEDFVTALAGEPVTDKWLTFTNDGTQLNFKGGGGVGVSKLAATTAVPADVVQGKTFYSKDKTLKTGTLADKPALNDAVSVGNDGNYLYARINVGAYRTKQSTGYPEIRFPNSDAIANIPGGDNGDWSGTYSGSNVTVPKGYHNGNGSVGVAGGNKGAWGSTINPGGSVTIPKGYHNGSGVVKANGNSINFHPIDRTVGWISGVPFTGEDATPGASGKMRFVLKYWCRTEYNVNGYIKVLRNGSEIHSTTFNKNYDSPYNDDVPNGYINVEFSGSGTYQIQVSVDYNAGNGEIKMGGAFIGY